MTLGLWIQLGAIVVSAGAVIFAVFLNQKTAKRRATLDLILNEQTKDRHIAARRRFVELRDSGEIVKYAAAENTATEDAFVIRSVLNRHEIVAIGIKQRTIDEQSYKDWYRTTLVEDWRKCKAFVMQIHEKTNTPTFFCELERLAHKWANDNESPHV